MQEKKRKSAVTTILQLKKNVLTRSAVTQMDNSLKIHIRKWATESKKPDALTDAEWAAKVDRSLEDITNDELHGYGLPNLAQLSKGLGEKMREALQPSSAKTQAAMQDELAKKLAARKAQQEGGGKVGG